MNKMHPSKFDGADPLARANHLAKQMARALENEDIADVALAVAVLTGGVILNYSNDTAQARALLDLVRKFEGQILLSAFHFQNRILQ